MADHRRQVEFAIAPELRMRGWKKKRLTWHLTQPDTILVFHVEKNSWGADSYSFHCGVYIPALGSEERPPVHHCPINTTAERIADDSDRVKQIGDFEDQSLSLLERLDAIRGVVTTIALPWLEAHATTRQLVEMVSAKYDTLFRKVFVTRAAYDYLRTFP